LIDINTLTPVEALLKLHEIKKLVGGWAESDHPASDHWRIRKKRNF
jgi:hypothetical protein